MITQCMDKILIVKGVNNNRFYNNKNNFFENQHVMIIRIM